MRENCNIWRRNGACDASLHMTPGNELGSGRGNDQRATEGWIWLIREDNKEVWKEKQLGGPCDACAPF